MHDQSTQLERFITAQEGVYETALHELRQGKKRSHWMWFIFPQLRGLGRSEMAHRYGIVSLDEASRFLGHPVLGTRLRLAVDTLQGLDRGSAEDVFGAVDAIKLRSCLTLFEKADDSGLFTAALERWFDGRRDDATLKLLTSGT